jgi:hypothetical protein
MPAREIHDHIHHTRQRSYRVVHHDRTLVHPAGERSLSGLETDGAGDVLDSVRPAADEEGKHEHRADRRRAERLGEAGIVVDEPGDHPPRDAAAAQRLRELERGVPARRVAPGAMPGEEQRRLRP